MKKLAVLCIAALGAALLVLGTAPAASAYPDLTCEVDVSAQAVRPGEAVTVFGHARVATDSQNQPVPPEKITWTFQWNGETQTRTGKDVQASFTAPQVTQSRTITLSARSESPAGTCQKTFDIQVIAPAVAGPKAPHGGGNTGDDGLPNTGGPAFWILVAALALLLGGGGAVMASRRRGQTPTT